MKLNISTLLFATILLSVGQIVYADDTDVSIEKLKKSETTHLSSNEMGVNTRGPGGLIKNMSSNADHQPDPQRKAELEALLAKQKKQLEELKKQSETSKSK